MSNYHTPTIILASALCGEEAQERVLLRRCGEFFVIECEHRDHDSSILAPTFTLDARFTLKASSYDLAFALFTQQVNECIMAASFAW